MVRNCISCPYQNLPETSPPVLVLPDYPCEIEITNSSRSTFMDCPYLYYLEYIRRLSPIEEAIYFRWGSLVHAISEYLDKGFSVLEAIEQERLRVEASTFIISDKVLASYEQMFTLLPDVFGAHLLHYKDEVGRYELLASEQKFKLSLPSGAVFRGKIDKIVRDTRSGIIYVWEIKTAAQTGASYWNRLPLDSQPKGYALAAQRVYGFPVVDVIYDVLKKPQIKQGVHESDADYTKKLAYAYLSDKTRYKYFERKPLHIGQAGVDAYFYQLDQVAQLIQIARDNVIYPQHHPGNRVGGCAYMSICLNGEGSFAENKFYVRRPDALFKELAEEAA